MQVEVRRADSHSAVHLSGEVDLATSPQARRAILDELAAGRPLLVDLSAVTYVDSSGLATLVEGYQTARRLGVRFCLVGTGPKVLAVLQLARLDRVFPLYASVEECLQDAG
jgi:anti-sigma B factor antagonist